MKRNALISVYDKSSLKKICVVLKKFDIGIISTGATAKKITFSGPQTAYDSLKSSSNPSTGAYICIRT